MAGTLGLLVNWMEMDDNMENLKNISKNSQLSDLLHLSGEDWNTRKSKFPSNQVGEKIDIERDVINGINSAVKEKENELECKNDIVNNGNSENVCRNENIVDFEINRKFNHEIENENPYIWTSILASTIVKKASLTAFLKKRRSMGACDIISELGNVVENFENKLYKEDE